MQYAGLATGILECRLQIDPRLSPAAVAACAVIFDERPDLLLEYLPGILPECGFVHVCCVGPKAYGQTEQG